jgi:ADP-ribose pyrophosphatase YjhB (NUDIX family)
MEHRFCAICGTALTSYPKVNGSQDHQFCSKCGFVDYKNPKPCVGAVIVKYNKVLLVRRAREPFKNHWDFPGGFLECGEHPHGGLKREVAEELRISIKIISLLGIYPDQYGAGGESTLNIYYLNFAPNLMSKVAL